MQMSAEIIRKMNLDCPTSVSAQCLKIPGFRIFSPAFHGTPGRMASSIAFVFEIRCAQVISPFVWRSEVA